MGATAPALLPPTPDGTCRLRPVAAVVKTARMGHCGAVDEVTALLAVLEVSQAETHRTSPEERP